MNCKGSQDIGVSQLILQFAFLVLAYKCLVLGIRYYLLIPPNLLYHLYVGFCVEICGLFLERMPNNSKIDTLVDNKCLLRGKKLRNMFSQHLELLQFKMLVLFK